MEATQKSTILVVDDTDVNIAILLGILSPEYRVMAAMDGPCALEAALEKLPDLIILDIMMPGMDGYEVCQRLKADERTRVIIMELSGVKTGLLVDSVREVLNLANKDIAPPPASLST